MLVRNYRPSEDWIPGTVVDRKGPHSCTVQVANGQLWHRHIEQLKEMRGSPHEDVLKNSSDIDTQSYEASPATPRITDTTPESGGTQQLQSDVAPHSIRY